MSHRTPASRLGLLFPLLLALVGCTGPDPTDPPIPPTSPAPGLTDAYVPHLGHTVRFRSRDTLRARAVAGKFGFPAEHLFGATPPTPLPVDSTGGGGVVCAIDGNDTLGDCGEAMAEHVDNILTYRQGKGTQSSHSLKALETQYLDVSGGDNGLSEEDVVTQIWARGIAGDPAAVAVAALDIDVTDVALARYGIDQFYTVEMAWSVPNDFLRNFTTGVKFLQPDRPNPRNGHFTPLADVDADGNYRIYTWGTYGWVSPSFIASVQPQCFIVFSPRQFDPKTGLDSKGRHIRSQAALWVTCGGTPIAESVLAAFPPVGPSPAPAPVVPPAPAPVPVPTPAPAPAGNWWVQFWHRIFG